MSELKNPQVRRSKNSRARSRNRSRQRSRARNSKLSEKARASEQTNENRRHSSPKMLIKTVEERKRRESREICDTHGGNIVAYENANKKVLCESCIFANKTDKSKITFTATVANGIQNTMKREHSDFIELARKFLAIDPEKMRERIEKSISEYFNIYRETIDELEELVVEKVQDAVNSGNLVYKVPSQTYFTNF